MYRRILRSFGAAMSRLRSTKKLRPGLRCRFVGDILEHRGDLRVFFLSGDGLEFADTNARPGVDYAIERIVFALKEDRTVILLRSAEGEEAAISVSDRLCAGDGLDIIVRGSFEVYR